MLCIWVENPLKQGGYKPSAASKNSYITIKPSENGSVTGPSVVLKGSSAEFEAIADSGYAVGDILVNGKVITDYTRDGVNAKFTVKNITAKNIEIPIMIMGITNQKVKDVELKNFDFVYADDKDYFDLRFNIPEQEKEYPECNRFRNINAYGVFVRHAQNIKLENINIKPREKTHRKFKKIVDCENFIIK